MPSENPAPSPSAEVLVGGQALLEGVMMRTPGGFGVAVRRPDGSIALQRGAVASLARRWPVLKLPVLRGAAVLIQALALGMKALNFSAEVATGEEAKEPERKSRAAAWASGAATALALIFGAGLFLFLPLWLAHLIEQRTGPLSSLSFNLVDGFFRALFFLGYLWAISRMKEIHRVFMYHGAEHKVVWVQEHGEALTVDNARCKSRLHPRCGTSFLLFVLFVSILIFALIPKSAPLLLKFTGRLVLLPLLAGLSYEVLRFTARHSRSPLFRAIVWPGLMLQRITTQEPSDDMLEVAIAALEEAWRAEGKLAERAPVVAATASEPALVMEA